MLLLSLTRATSYVDNTSTKLPHRHETSKSRAGNDVISRRLAEVVELKGEEIDELHVIVHHRVSRLLLFKNNINIIINFITIIL